MHDEPLDPATKGSWRTLPTQPGCGGVARQAAEAYAAPGQPGWLSRHHSWTAGPPEGLYPAGSGPPNGITWDAARSAFLLAPWEGGTILRAWDPVTGEITDVTTLVGGHCDGIEIVDGSVLITSQDDDTLYRVESGAVRPLVRVTGDPADIGVDTRRGRVAVPYIALGRADVWALP